MFIPKRYGQSKSNKCPFCGVEAVFHNPQGIPVCRRHKDSRIDDLTCVCGGSLEPRTGKFGPYFHCLKCGNVNFRRALEVNQGSLGRRKEPDKSENKTQTTEQAKKDPAARKEIVVRSDELDSMY